MKLMAGVGLFLFAMYLIEEALKNLSGRNFKIFLQRITKNKLGAVAGGAISAGVLQSSSLVSLMVLAFVGAGVFTLKNALAIILGANLGTTLDSWLVATVGFKMNIAIIAYPAVCVGGILLIFFGSRKLFKYISFFLFGFGLLFIGLSFMQTSMESQVKAFDFTKFADVSLITFLFIGFLITVIIQSSSVTMALTLSALHTGIIGFIPAAAIVLGSETGTTIKLMFGAIGGSASKKRLVLGNFLFNVFLTSLTFTFIYPILDLITVTLAIRNPLIALVTFASLVNIISLTLFIPFLDPFVKFLEKLFKDSEGSASEFIRSANANEPETAFDLFKTEAEYFINNTMIFVLSKFKIATSEFETHTAFNLANEKRRYLLMTDEEKYDLLKLHQGEIQSFYIKLRTRLSNENIGQLNQLISAVRSAMHSAKSIKDIDSNISNLSRSSKDVKYEFFIHHQTEISDLYSKFNKFRLKTEPASFEKLQTISNTIQKNYMSALNEFYANAQVESIEDIDITTAINFNRELFTSNKAMLMAIKDLLLDEKEAQIFNEIPVYKT